MDVSLLPILSTCFKLLTKAPQLESACCAAAAKVVPAIAQLFSSSDRAIRRSLLEGIESFARHFDTELVEEKIFPAIATGAPVHQSYFQ